MASVLVFCVPCALMSICLDPTHLVTCLLINFPQLLSLVTLLICSLKISLCCAVLCGFVLYSLSSQVKSSQVKSSQVKSSQVKSSQVKSSQVKSSQVKSSSLRFLFCYLVFPLSRVSFFQPCWLLFRLVIANFLLIFTFAIKDFLKSPWLFCVWVLSAKTYPDTV